MRAYLTLLLALTCALPAYAASPAKAPVAEKEIKQELPEGAIAKPAKAEDGSFKFCAVENSYPDGTKLTLAMSPLHQINLGVTIPKAGFVRGSRYDISYGFDGGVPQKYRARALSDNTLVLEMDVNPQFAASITSGKTLEIGGGGKAVRFPLEPLHQSVAALTACVEKHGGEKTEVDPLPESLRSLLNEAGLQNSKALSLGNVPIEQRPADYIWSNGALMGGVLTLRVPPDKELATLVGVHTNGLKKKCTGAFTSQVSKEIKLPAVVLRQVVATCQMRRDNQDHPVVVSILFTLSSDHSLTLFTHETEPAHQAEAVAASEGLSQAIQKRMKSEDSSKSVPTK